MTDEELIAKLKAGAPKPKQADDAQFWATFEAEVAKKIAEPPRRRVWPAVAVALAAAAALTLVVHGHGRPSAPSNPMPGANAAALDELLPSEDPVELVGDLDLDELHVVDHEFHGGV
jgi:hypothetical protein